MSARDLSQKERVQGSQEGQPIGLDEPLAVAAEGVGRLLGVSRAQVFKLNATGKLPMPVRLGSKTPRWPVAELRDWLAAGCPDRLAWDRMRREVGESPHSPRRSP
ncbi:MAG: AlpA family phage regulatory protein [Phycisphaerales bacterium]|nr:AlpA family phage regulatory protein [Phycisphaerales bacterium]